MSAGLVGLCDVEFSGYLCTDCACCRLILWVAVSFRAARFPMRKATNLRFESLEQRLAMDAGISAVLTNGVLTITGTQDNDELTIARRGAYFRIEQTDEQFHVGQVDRIAIDLGDGNDTIRLAPAGKSFQQLNVTGGQGNDEFVGPSGQKWYFGESDLLTRSKGGSVSINGGKPDWFSQNISDTSLRDAARAAAVDKVFSRDDMMDLFADVAAETEVGSYNMESLRAIVGKKSFFAGLPYVQTLSTYIVNGSVANGHYQGQALGNLHVASTGSDLQLLVNKWFLGLDHPETNRAGWSAPLTYKEAAGVIFDGAPSYTQVDQGVLGDCYFLSAMTSITTKDPQKIVDMFIDNGDNTWTVQFFDKSKPYFVTIDKMLPVDAQDEFVFTCDEQRYDNPSLVLWAALAEKAYAQFAEFGLLDTDGPKTNSYAALDEGYPNLAMANILGKSGSGMQQLESNSAAAIIRAFRNDKPVTLVSEETPTSSQVVSDHVYAMLGYNASTQKFALFNPWGLANNNNGKPGILHLTYAEISANFGYWNSGVAL